MDEVCLVSVASSVIGRVAANYNSITATAGSTKATMADASGPLPDFFASDGESDAGENTPAETVPSESELVGPSIPSSRASTEDPAVDNPLFLPDEEETHGDFSVERLRSVSARPGAASADDVDMSDIFGIHQDEGSKPAARRQSEDVFQPNKRRKLSPPSDFDFKSAFLGSVVVANAWSTVKGKGYVKNGDQIFVEWDKLEQEEDLPKKGTKRKPPQKKGKQLTITALVKPRYENFKKKKQNDIVRLTNKGGFGEFAQLFTPHRRWLMFHKEIARLPQNVASWAARLLETGLVHAIGW